MVKFVRTLDDGMIKEIKETNLFHSLKEDILNGKVFPAIRANSIQFYYKGGLLFKYDKGGFQTHYKYLINNDRLEKKYIINNGDEEIKENNLIIKNFVKGYDSIKNTLDKYAKLEATLTSGFYSKSIFKKDVKGNNLLIDIEAAFAKQLQEEVYGCDISVTDKNKRTGTDRIDAVFFDKKARRIIFCEVKRFDDERIYSKNIKEAEVINQLKRYQTQIESRKEGILEAYNYAMQVYNKLFGIEVRPIKDIYPQAVLFVTGCPKILYDGKTKEAVEKIRKEGFKVHFADKPSGTALNYIVKICKE